MSPEEKKGLGDFLRTGAPQGPSVRYKAVGGRKTKTTARGVPGPEKRGTGPGRALRREPGLGGPGVGSPGSPGEGRGCGWPARFLPLPGKGPAQRSLSRAETELVSRLAAGSAKGPGAGRSQEVRRAAAGLKERWEDLTGDPDQHSDNRLNHRCWGHCRHCVCVLAAHD